jgi:hypothetical protein
MTRSLLLAALLGACGTEQISDAPDASIEACTTPASGRLLPLSIGATWTYIVTPSGGGAPEAKTNTIEAFEDVGDRKAGVMAFRARTEKLDGITVSWQQDTCDGVRRHRERSLDLAGALISDQFYVPEKIRIDETAAHVVLGATWSTSYVEVEVDPVTAAVATKDKTDLWTIEAVDEEIIVPAGTFTTIKIHRVGEEEGQADKTYWYAKGVGKVREVGKQTEELMSWSLD